MRKIILIILFSSFGCYAFSQGKQVQLVSSQKIIGLPEQGLLRVIHPIFSQEGSTLSADSANFNQDKNTFDAFGSVVITQSNGTTVYSDILNYNGNTRLARLTRNVRLVDGDATLTTDFLTYNMGTRIGTYTGGGKIVNGANVLTSKNGYYFATSRDAYFRHDVVVTSPDAIINSDTLRYNSGSKIAYFYGPTHIYGKDDTLYTENGQYNTQNDQASFGKNNLYTQGSKSLKGDSLFYDRRLGYGRAIGNITFTDAAQKFTFRGDIGLYRKADESILATKNAYVVITTESDSAKIDSIWMTADILFSRVIPIKELQPVQQLILKNNAEADSTIKKPERSVEEAQPIASIGSPEKDKSLPPTAEKTEKPVAAESREAVKLRETRKKKNREEVKTKQLATTVPKLKTEPAEKDTARTRIVMAYHHAKIYKSDLQARADSLFFSYADSIVRCYVAPMIWTQGSQMSSDTVYIRLKNKKLDYLLLQNDGFIVNTEKDSAKFNQVKGKVMRGYFRDNKMDKMFVDGNAESIYYAKEDTGYLGMNKSVSSRMKILFKDNTLQDVFFIKKPELTFFPMDKIPEDATILEGFIWKPKERPRSKEEIIPGLAKSIRNTEEKKLPEPVPVNPKPGKKSKKPIRQ